MRRLKTREQYQAVLAHQPLAKTAHFALHRASHTQMFGDHEAWMGAMAPKRWAKRAVTRNLIKRQIYIAAERFESMLSCVGHVIRLRSVFDLKKFKSATSEQLRKEIRAEIEYLLAKASNSPADNKV